MKGNDEKLGMHVINDLKRKFALICIKCILKIVETSSGYLIYKIPQR